MIERSVGTSADCRIIQLRLQLFSFALSEVRLHVPVFHEHERSNRMFGYYDDFGRGRGIGRESRSGRGGAFGYRRCGGFGRGMGRGPGFFGESEIETMKCRRDRLDLRKREIEEELKYIDEQIASLQK